MLQSSKRKSQQKEKKKEIIGIVVSSRRKELMSKKYPECPLYNHSSCKERDIPTICAIVREDKKCLKKEDKPGSKKNKTRGEN